MKHPIKLIPRILLVTYLLILLGCSDQPKTWQAYKSFALDRVNPIGLAFNDEGLWLSDGDRNRLVLVNDEGHIVRTIDSLERPMHIDSDKNTLYVPLYGHDIVAKISKKAVLAVPLKDSLDAPAGISVRGDELAVADFYNHRILYSQDGKTFVSIGVEGKNEGELYYPTDVQLTEEHIWVADAYNNRVQVFTKDGSVIKVIGSDQNINAATGLFVDDTEVFVTDFENSRILVFNHHGDLLQVISEGVEKPTDVLVKDGRLYILNYKSGVVQILEQREAKD